MQFKLIKVGSSVGIILGTKLIREYDIKENIIDITINHQKKEIPKGFTYGYIHQWVRKYKPKPENCEQCKKNIKECWGVLDLCNISGGYKRDINDFEYLCRKCHMTKDGRMKIQKLGKKAIPSPY